MGIKNLIRYNFATTPHQQLHYLYQSNKQKDKQKKDVDPQSNFRPNKDFPINNWFGQYSHFNFLSVVQ